MTFRAKEETRAALRREIRLGGGSGSPLRLDVTSADIDAWLRGLNVSPSSRNGMLL